jgi:hypothetical protein
MIPGFMGSMFVAAKAPELVLIDRTEGTNRGDMTVGGGLAAVFDGVTNQAVAACAYRSVNATGYVGKTLAAPRCIGQAITFGANNAGYTSAANVTLNLYAKNGAAPASATDGTIIGTTGSFSNSASTNSKIINSTDLVTVWSHVWITVQHSGTGQPIMAELQLYAWE